jgi:hypothetical protein
MTNESGRLRPGSRSINAAQYLTAFTNQEN